jgi:RNA polymerase sigma factor (sigma-70 family)
VTRDARRPSADATAPESEARAAELARRFERALSELSEGQRTVFLLRHSGDLTLSEVAETLDVALPTVKTQFARACLKLQEKLATYRPDRESSS